MSIIGKNEIIINQAENCDIPSMVRLLSVLFTIENDFSHNMKKQEDGLKLMLSDKKNRRVMVARTDNKVIGMATAQIVASTTEGVLCAWVEGIVVDREYRRGKVGSRLLSSIELWACSVGAKRMECVTEYSNKHTIEFYDSNGWNQASLACLRKVISNGNTGISPQ